MSIEHEFKALRDPVLLNKQFNAFKQKSLLSQPETQDDEVEEIEEDDEEIDPFIHKVLRVLFKLIHKLKTHSKLVSVIVGLLFLNILVISSMKPSYTSLGNIDIATSLNNLQFQINELNTRNKNRILDFKNYLDLKIDEFNTRLDVINSIDLNHDIQIGDDKIPILLDNEGKIKILPEFENFLKKFIIDQLNNEVDLSSKFEVDYDSLIKNHIEELLNSNLKFLSKDEILNLINENFNQNRRKLINDIKNLSNLEISDKLISNDGSKYSSNDHINYSLFTSGARIINYLTSPTFKPKFKSNYPFLSWFQSNKEDIEELESSNLLLSSSSSSSPFIVLTTNEGFWRSSKVNDTQLAINFLDPIYLTNFQYIHKKVMNASFLNSCPKKISIFIKTNNNDKYSRYSAFNEFLDHENFFKIIEFDYDLNSSLEKQGKNIPDFFKKVLVKSIIIRIDSNYGNNFFTSLNKFEINGFTRLDVLAIKELLKNEEFDSDLKLKFRELLP